MPGKPPGKFWEESSVEQHLSAGMMVQLFHRDTESYVPVQWAQSLTTAARRPTGVMGLPDACHVRRNPRKLMPTQCDTFSLQHSPADVLFSPPRSHHPGIRASSIFDCMRLFGIRSRLLRCSSTPNQVPLRRGIGSGLAGLPSGSSKLRPPSRPNSPPGAPTAQGQAEQKVPAFFGGLFFHH